MKKVLLIAFHYPPLQVSSGLQRTLKFSQYLSDFDWEPLILTINPRAYASKNDTQMGDIPNNIIIKRAFGLSTTRHLSFKGKYLAALAYPDAWISWWPMAVISGYFLIKKNEVDIISSTYPIATSHLIGLALHKLTKKPWVADFRDSMTEENYPSNPQKRKIYQWIERKTIENCTRAVFTTEGAKAMYAKRYPAYSGDKWGIIENAFDDENFSQAVAVAEKLKKPNGPLTLVHSGVIYPLERDPSDFFDAVMELKEAGLIRVGKLKIVLRAAGHNDIFLSMIKQRDIEGIVFLEPAVPYIEALAEMLNADALLIFQAANCNHQIPAKVYEYLRAEKPILALTDKAGDTAGVLERARVGNIVPLDDKEAIKKGLLAFIEELKNNTASKADESVWSKHTRYARTEQLARLLDEMAY